MIRYAEYVNPTEKKRLVWLRVLSFALSITYLTWVPRLPEIKDHLHLTVGELGQILMLVGLVGLFSSKLNSTLLIRYGSRKIVFIAAPVAVIGNLMVASASEPILLIAGMAIASLTSFLTNTAAITQGNNIRMSSGIDPQANMSAIANIGSLFAMAFGAVLLQVLAAGPYIILMSVISATALVIAGINLAPTDLHSKPVELGGAKMPWFGKGTGVFWFMVAAVFASTTAEFSVSDWGAIVSRDYFGIPGPYYLLPFVAFQSGVVSARFATDALGTRFGVARFVSVSTPIAATIWGVCLVITAMLGSSSPWLSLALTLFGFAVGGWGVGPMWPVFISAINVGPYPAAIALPRFFSTVSLAFVLGPGGLGILANAITLPFALVVTAGMLFFAGTQARTKVIGGGVVAAES